MGQISMVPEISAKMLYHRPQKAEKHVVTVAVDQTRGSEGREGGTEGTEPWYRAGRDQQSPGVSGQGKGPAPQIWMEGAAVEHFADREHYQQRSDDEVQGGAKRGGEK